MTLSQLEIESDFKYVRTKKLGGKTQENVSRLDSKIGFSIWEKAYLITIINNSRHIMRKIAISRSYRTLYLGYILQSIALRVPNKVLRSGLRKQIRRTLSTEAADAMGVRKLAVLDYLKGYFPAIENKLPKDILDPILWFGFSASKGLRYRICEDYAASIRATEKDDKARAQVVFLWNVLNRINDSLMTKELSLITKFYKIRELSAKYYITLPP